MDGNLGGPDERCDCEDVSHLEDLINTKDFEAISVAINKIAVFNYIEAAIIFFIVFFTLVSLPLCPANRYGFYSCFPFLTYRNCRASLVPMARWKKGGMVL